MALSPGARFASKYRIESKLGEGGMGVVYIATNERLRKRVALKVLGDAVAANPDLAERFTREAIAASRVSHPGVVEVFDADVHEGVPWIAMELLEGEGLGERLARGPMSVPDVLSTVRAIVDVLVAVHASGIIHRDLKPDNVFLQRLPDGSERVKLLDFGIAKIVDHELGTQTKTGVAMGTPFFLAPEQATNAKDIDARADVYSVGVLLFHALTGELPYQADSFGDLVRQLYTRGPRPLGAIRPSLPPDLVSLVDRCLSVQPDGRPENAQVLAAQLASIGAGPGVARTVAMAASQPAMTPATMAIGGAPPPQISRPAPAPASAGGPSINPVQVGLGCVLLLAVAGAGASFALVGGDEDDDTPPPPPVVAEVVEADDPPEPPDEEPPSRPGQQAVPAPPDVAAPPANAQRTASGLASRVLRRGNGNTHPGPRDRVTVHYTGWTTDGQMFDSSRQRGRPATFPLDRVIPGWTEGVQLMVVGEQRRLWIPEDLAYRGRPGAPQGMLVFDIELISFESSAPAPPTPPDVAAPPPSAQRTASGLASRVLRPGTGTRHPTATDRVRVHYTGWTTDGEMFDSSITRGAPATFQLNRVIAGWTEGLQLMVEGERRRLWIPENLAYAGRPGAPQGMLVFDVELIEILDGPP